MNDELMAALEALKKPYKNKPKEHRNAYDKGMNNGFNYGVQAAIAIINQYTRPQPPSGEHYGGVALWVRSQR